MIAMRTGLNALKVKQDVGRVVIVLLTDGRSNIPLSLSETGLFNPDLDPRSRNGVPSREYLKDEAIECAKKLGSLPDFDLLVIDTEDKFVGTGTAREIAAVAGGNYHRLIEADG